MFPSLFRLSVREEEDSVPARGKGGVKFSRGSHGSHGRHGNRATAKYLRRDRARVDERAESDGTAYTILPSRS